MYYIVSDSNLRCQAAVPNPFGTRDWFGGRQCFHRLRAGDGGFRMLQEQEGLSSCENSVLLLIWQGAGLRQWCEWWGAAVNTDEALLIHLLLPSCCVAWFLTDHRPVLAHGPGSGDPCSRVQLPPLPSIRLRADWAPLLCLCSHLWTGNSSDVYPLMWLWC